MSQPDSDDEQRYIIKLRSIASGMEFTTIKWAYSEEGAEKQALESFPATEIIKVELL